MPKIGKEDKEYQRKIARERVWILLREARKVVKEDENLAKYYVETAVKLARKHRVRLGKLKYTFCRRCFVPFTPETVRVRLVRKPYPMVVYKCLRCGAEYHVPYVREKKEKRKAVSQANL